MNLSLVTVGLAIGVSVAFAASARAERTGDAGSCVRVTESSAWPKHGGMYLTVIANTCFHAIKVTACAADKWCEIEVIEYPGGPKVIATKGKPSKITAVLTKPLRKD